MKRTKSVSHYWPTDWRQQLDSRWLIQRQRWLVLLEPPNCGRDLLMRSDHWHLRYLFNEKSFLVKEFFDVWLFQHSEFFFFFFDHVVLYLIVFVIIYLILVSWSFSFFFLVKGTPNFKAVGYISATLHYALLFTLKISCFLGTNHNLVVYAERKSSPPVVQTLHVIIARQLVIKSKSFVFEVSYTVFKHKEYCHAVHGCVIYLNFSLLLWRI